MEKNNLWKLAEQNDGLKQLLTQLSEESPVLFNNEVGLNQSLPDCEDFTDEDLNEAEGRLNRFRPFFALAFPETAPVGGLIESELRPVPRFQNVLSEHYENLPKNLFIKCDSHLPISGSIKARGGIYEVLHHAENLAKEAGLIDSDKDYSQFYSETFQKFFNQYTVAVGSTGNLGLSIGIISAVLGFKVNVHMSSDAKAWKKDLLRRHGVMVYEYETDYSEAVAAGRKRSDEDPYSYFVDDEHSRDLFLGYTVAARRLENQLKQMNIAVTRESPLYVYLPCGVGGGPGGVAYGLKEIYKDLVHLYFAEPVASPCMILGVATKTHEEYSVQDLGLSNKTLADGLAVGRASGMVSRLMTSRLSGLSTVTDNQLLIWLGLLNDSESLKLEPSALAGVGPYVYRAKTALGEEASKNGTHILWATGGAMVPSEDYNNWYEGYKSIDIATQK